MAKRASLSGEKAEAVLNIVKPEPAPTALDEGTGGVFDHIGTTLTTTQRVVDEVPLERIRANPFQPRWAVDEATVTALVHSFSQRGFFGTLTARQRGRWFELAYGHQRLEAARQAGLTTLPLEVRELSDEEMLEFALSENLQRKDLSQLEEGEIFVRWQREMGRSERDIAERLGKSRGYVRNRIETATLPDDLKTILREQATRSAPEADEVGLPPRFELSPAAAKELARVPGEPLRRRLTAEVLSRQLNFQQTKLLVEHGLRAAETAEPPTPSRAPARAEHMFGSLMRRLEEEARRIPTARRQEAIQSLDELIARAEQIRESLRKMR